MVRRFRSVALLLLTASCSFLLDFDEDSQLCDGGTCVRLDGGAPDGGRTDGGRTDGGRTDGGRTDGGRTDGGDGG